MTEKCKPWKAIVMGIKELKRFPGEVNWVKPMGKFDLEIKKNWKAVPQRHWTSDRLFNLSYLE